MCGILTCLNVLPEGDPARVDTKKRIIEEAPWFRFPYPCKKAPILELKLISFRSHKMYFFKFFTVQFGIPTVSIGAVLGILCGVLTSTVESIGDYYCCASIIRK